MDFELSDPPAHLFSFPFNNSPFSLFIFALFFSRSETENLINHL